MGLRVHHASRERVEIALPLAPNVNPHGTIFGGAQTAACLVGGWMLMFDAFARAGVSAQVVGKEARCEFLAPAAGDCLVVTTWEQADIDSLLARFAENGRARQPLLTVVRYGDVEVSRLQGLYTAIGHAAAATSHPSSPTDSSSSQPRKSAA